MWKNTNANSDLINKRVAAAADDDPITGFLHLEAEIGLSLIREIHRQLSDLSKILRGSLLITNSHYEVAKSLMRHQTPET